MNYDLYVCVAHGAESECCVQVCTISPQYSSACASTLSHTSFRSIIEPRLPRCSFGIVPTVGLAPLGRDTLDVLGPLTRTVPDAALALNVMAGVGSPNFTGKNVPASGYGGLIGTPAASLAGKSIGLYGPGWRSEGIIVPEVAALYAQATDELVALGATVVEDPFAGTGFADVGASDAYGFGFAGAAYDFQNYLKGLDIASFAEFVEIVGASPATPEGPLSFILDDVPLGADGAPDAQRGAPPPALLLLPPLLPPPPLPLRCCSFFARPG